jgi:hypothetical protein
VFKKLRAMSSKIHGLNNKGEDDGREAIRNGD